MKYNVALWGIGQGYNKFTSLHGHKLVNVVVLVDSYRTYYSKIDNIPVITPNKLADFKFDYLIITTYDNTIFNEIQKKAIKLGFHRDLILPLRIFEISFFNFNDYIKIKDSNISILSDYCFAGFLYRRLGLRFNSPTINMFADNDNYFKFISNLDKYLNTPIKEYKANAWAGVYSYNQGIIDDVVWQFNHYTYCDEAIKKWEERKKRFNSNNYVIIMTIQSDEMARKFDKLNHPYKIGFYWKDLGLKSIVVLKEWNSPEFRKKYEFCFSGYVNILAYDGDTSIAINWLNFLLHKKNYLRIE